MPDSSSRHREPPHRSLVRAALDCFVASLLAMTVFGLGDRC